MATNQSWNPTQGISNYSNVTAVPELAENQAATAQTSPNVPAITNSTSNTGVAQAQTRDIANDELMSSNVANLIAEDSPLLQRARSQSLQQSNARGLLNSSFANENALGAVIDRAMPIAQYDASARTGVKNQNLANEQQTNTYNAGQEQQNNQFNANSQNTTNQFNNTQQQNNNQFNAQTQTQNSQFNANNANDTSRFNASEQNAVIKQMIDQSNKLQLADIEASYKTILQSEASAGSLYQQSVRNISDILQNPDLTPEAKTAAVANQNALLETGLNILGKIGGLNLDGLLNFPGANMPAVTP